MSESHYDPQARMAGAVQQANQKRKQYTSVPSIMDKFMQDERNPRAMADEQRNASMVNSQANAQRQAEMSQYKQQNRPTPGKITNPNGPLGGLNKASPEAMAGQHARFQGMHQQAQDMYGQQSGSTGQPALAGLRTAPGPGGFAGMREQDAGFRQQVMQQQQMQQQAQAGQAAQLIPEAERIAAVQAAGGAFQGPSPDPMPNPEGAGQEQYLQQMQQRMQQQMQGSGKSRY